MCPFLQFISSFSYFNHVVSRVIRNNVALASCKKQGCRKQGWPPRFLQVSSPYLNMGGGADYANQITSRRPPSLQISRTSDILVKSCLFALSAVNLTRNKSLTYGVVRPNVPDQPDPTQPEFGPWGPPDSTQI